MEMTPVVQCPPGLSTRSHKRWNRFSRVGAGARRGLTLLEVMIAVAVLVLTLLGYLGSLVLSYRMEEDARRRDQVRAILQSFADDFMCQDVRDPSRAVKPFFRIETAPTGAGLAWTDSSGATSVGDLAGLRFRLGGDPAAPEVVVTRQVREVNQTPTMGTPVLSLTNPSSVGRELVGEFVGTYLVGNRRHTLTLRVVRMDVYS